MSKSVLPHANNKGTDQPAHPRSLIGVFVVRWLDSIIPLVSISKTSKPLASLYCSAGRFESYLVATPEDRFSRDVVHLSRVMMNLFMPYMRKTYASVQFDQPFVIRSLQ